jgi:hypothetical protein
MASLKKQLSNPFSTGGGGNNFETRVQASFVALMLSGGFAPCMPTWPIIKIKLQGKYKGFDVDDAIVFIESPDQKEERKLLCQIKHSISITATNKIFRDVIQAAWNDFNNAELFTVGKDSIALVTGPLSITDINDVRWILEQARHSESSTDFLTKINLAKFSSKAKIKKLEVFKVQLKSANGGNSVLDDVFWQFMRSFNLLGYDLDIKAGVTLSLVQSLIGQYSPENANALWTQIVGEVQSANQNAGTITIDSLPEDIRNAFQKPVVKKIPDKHLGIKPSVPQETNWNNLEFASEIALANLLGAWNEKTEADRSIIEQLTKIRFDDWTFKIRRILKTPDSPLSLQNGVWSVAKRHEMWKELGTMLFDDHLDNFKKITVDVLRESNPQFELKPDERYMANIRGKVLQHSLTLRKGLAETLALLGTQPEALKNCSLSKPETTAIISIREIFQDSNWVLWGSLNNLLPTLAEAAPGEFLSAVENALKKTPSPFDELFSQEGSGITGANYMTGLLWALETLAWDEEYLVRTTVLLGKLALRDPGGNWGNRPANSLTAIFLPWFPQTMTSIDKRKAAIKTLQKECPKIAWKLLLCLLPSRHQTSMGSHRPTWRKSIPDDYNISVTKKEYWEQVSCYTEITLEMAKGDFDKINELATNLSNLPKPFFNIFLDYLNTIEIKGSSEEKRTILWDTLTKFTIRQKRHSDEKWAFPPEIIEKIENIASHFAPQTPEKLYARLFKNRSADLYDKKGSWQEQEKKLEEDRQNAIKVILEKGGIEAVLHFSKNVESPRRVGYSLGIISEDDIDGSILPNLIEDQDGKIKEFTSAFVFAKHSKQGLQWLDQVGVEKWSKEQIGIFLSYLPCTKEAWDYALKFLGEHEAEYWKRVNVYPYDEKSDWDYAVEKLIKYKRPNAAISCLNAILHKKENVNIALATKALLDAVSTEEPLHEFDTYNTVEVIHGLQNNPEVNPDDLFRIEWAYLPLLTSPDEIASPKLLEQKLASDPDFFCELIRVIYRSKNDSGIKKESTEQEKAIAINAWHLLSEWQEIPGKNPDGSFSSEKFNDWLKTVKTKCEESGHLDVAMITLGEALIHSPSDPDGLWIHRTIAEALNSEDATKMRNGFSTGTFNSRGVYCVDPTGKPEKDLAAKYKKQADEVENAGYFRFAGTLRNLAMSYEDEAKRISEGGLIVE